MGAHGYAVGVDFGTSTSLVAARTGRRPVEIAPLGRTTRSFPSIAGYQDGTLVVGEDADALPHDEIVHSIKRAITENRTTVTLPGPDGARQVPADDVITGILAEIGRRADAAGQPLTPERELRLGCPAMWEGDQRKRLLGLAEKAGLPVDDATLVDEPIAAGVAWVRDRFLAHGERPTGRLLVFDMGGGTLDIAVLDIVGGERPEISVLSAMGAALAGDMLDQRIARDLTDDLAGRGFEARHARRPELFPALVQRAAREAKVKLSRLREHPVLLPSRQLGQVPILTYTREQLEEAFRPQLDLAAEYVWGALQAARLTERGNRSTSDLRGLDRDVLARDVDFVLLAGGMSRIPYVERRLGELFPRAQVFDNAGVQPDEAIVAGLADTASYERLNLHRPGFDFTVEWEEDGQLREEVLYPAFTPLYTAREVLSGHDRLGFARHGREVPGPLSGTGRLRVRTTSGAPMVFSIDGRETDGVSLTFGRHIGFVLYCDGQILIRHGNRHEVSMRVDRWPVIRGRDHAQLVLRTGDDDAVPEPSAGWHMEKEYAYPGPRLRSEDAPSWSATPMRR